MPAVRADAQGLWRHSRFAQRIARRYPDELKLLAQARALDLATLARCHAALTEQGHDLGASLRILRQVALAWLVRVDCDEQATLATVTATMTTLAEFALDLACRQAVEELSAVHGAPRAEDGRPAQLWIVGMGKLGARELNVSSDIDLVYLYDHEGETTGVDGRQRISHHEFFGKVVKRIWSLLGETTEHGFVFRIDLALRPNGNSGPPVVSQDALEDYLQMQGREWERFAWLKSRVVAPRQAVADGSAAGLRGTVLPFVFRRYLDYSVFEALRVLHGQIRDHAARRAAGRPARANDVKLSRGGIREIEFIVQLLQVVRGGQYPELRTRATLAALERVAAAGLMAAETARALAAAYTFLRRVEHRIQYLDDQQTHVLPGGCDATDGDLTWIARTMGYADCRLFLHALDAHRELVAQEFDRLLGGSAQCTGCQGPGARRAGAPTDLALLLEQVSPALRERLAPWAGQPRWLALRDDGRARLLRLVERTDQWLAQGRASEVAALRMLDWIEPLMRRESYLALLVERPGVHERLLRLLGAARWPARYLLRHPGVIDELASATLAAERFDAAALERELHERRLSLQATGEDSDEALLDLLRRAHHAELFRTLARDLEGALSVEQVADELSALADAMLAITARWCWERLRDRHRQDPCFAVIGYGKLGGKELGYGSDLDIVFVYDDEDERAPEIYGAYARKLINWLTVKTGEGDLFEIDTALRPNGNSGLLVTSFAAFERYQLGRGSNTAWTWEHQAMTRARCVIGAAGVRERFDGVREQVITAPRDQSALRAEIMAMRDRVGAAHPVKAGRFDVKHSPGGMVDVEFAVQYLVLAHAADHPALRPNAGNIALLRRAQAAHLLPPGVGDAAANAYRALRKVQHQARLDEAPTQLAADQLVDERAAIGALWQAVFGAAGARS